MTIYRFRGWWMGGPLALAVALLVDACSDEKSAPGASGGAGATPLASACGELTAAQARTAAIDRMLAFENAVLDAWPAVEDSRVLPRALGMGQSGSFGTAAEGREDIQAQRDDLARYVFADANLESAQGAEVVFQLKPTTYCSRIVDDCVADQPPVAVPAGGAGGASAVGGCTSQFYLDDYHSCVQEMTDHEMRVKITRIACDAGMNVRLALMAGAERISPASLELYQEHAIARVDFGSVAQAIPLLADPGDQVTVIAGSAGQLQVELRVPSPGQVTFRADVPQAVDFSWTDNGEPNGFAIAAGERVLEVGLNAGEETAQASIALGLTTIKMPLDGVVSGWFGATLSDAAHQHDIARFELAGVTGRLAYEGSTDSLHATGLGLGASSSKLVYGTSTLLGIDVDAEGDRKIDGDFGSTANGELEATLRPGLPLVLNYSMNKVSSYCTGLPPFALDDTLTIDFADPSSASARFLLDTNGDAALTGTQVGALLSVSSGQLGLKSRITPAESLSVGAGQCLWRDANRTGVHVVLRTLYAAACP